MKPSHKEKSEEKEKVDNVKNEEREELDFQFDEELDTPPPTGRHNAFSEWSEDDEDYELSDRDVNKLLIFTQTTVPISTRIPKHEGHDRTGDWTTRVKMTQGLSSSLIIIISRSLHSERRLTLKEFHPGSSLFASSRIEFPSQDTNLSIDN